MSAIYLPQVTSSSRIREVIAGNIHEWMGRRGCFAIKKEGKYLENSILGCIFAENCDKLNRLTYGNRKIRRI